MEVSAKVSVKQAAIQQTILQAPALVHLPHPLTGDGRQVFVAAFLPDETVGDYLARHGVALPRASVSLWCNDIPVPSANWESLMPAPGDRLVMRTALEGHGGGGKIFRTIAMIAIAAAAVYTGGAATALYGGFAGALASTAVMIGGSLLVNTLLPPPKAALNSGTNYQGNSETPTYALDGGRNTARLYEPLLLCLGYNKVIPDLASQPYTEFAGQDQYLYQAFHFGLSDTGFTDFRIGDTPISSYADVTIQISGPDGRLPMIAGNVDSVTVQDLKAALGWIQRTTSADTITIAIDVVATAYYINDKGRMDPRGVFYSVQYCPAGTGAWTDWPGGNNRQIVGTSQTPVRETLRLDVPKGQYDVRVIKNSGDISSTREVNALSWAQLRSYQEDTADYTGQSRVGLKIRASSQLNGTIDSFSAKVQAVCPVWNGSSWVTQATSNPAWWFLWFARGKFINGRRVYGAGLPDSRIDIAGLIEWGAYCDANGLTCNFVQGAAASISTVLDQIALNGDGAATWLTGKLGVVWDAPNRPPVMQFGPFNIKRDSFQVEYNTQDLADEIIISFTNPDKGWTTDQVRVSAPNVSAPGNPVTLDFTGCTSAALAGRKANLMAAAQYYHRRKITWISDLEGFVAQRGDVVVLSHDMTVWSYAGRMTGGDRTTLHLDRPVPLSATPGYAGIRFPDGTYQVFGVQGGSGVVTTITLSAAIPGNLPVPLENPDIPACDWAFFYDPLATPGKPVKITAVIPQVGGDEVQIIATDEEALYCPSQG